MTQGVHNPGGVVHGQGGLGHISQVVRIANLKLGHVSLVLYQVHAIPRLPHGALHLGMPGMTDEDALHTTRAIP